MKANWSGPEYPRMADRHPLFLAAVDLELLGAHIQKEIRPTLTIVASTPGQEQLSEIRTSRVHSPVR